MSNNSSPNSSPSHTTPSEPIEYHKLDKESFNQEIKLLALRVPVQALNLYLKKYAQLLFQRPRMKRVFETTKNNLNNNIKLVLVNENYLNYEDLPSDFRTFHENEYKKFINKDKENEKEDESYEFYDYYSLLLTYKDLSVEEVLKKICGGILKEIPSAYEQAGHIAHLNIREEALPYKYTIGQVILDKNPSIKTVVNKIGNIETEFRTFPLELIAGEENYIASVKESNANLTFDFAKVYWNSRLQTEHLRMVHLIRSAAVDAALKSPRYPDGKVIVADMTAGVGPFAIPLGMITGKALSQDKAVGEQYIKNFKLGNNLDNSKEDNENPKKMMKLSYPSTPIIVHANDLNPCSYQYLNQNIVANGCQSSVFSYNLCAREFIKMLVDEKSIMPHECIINLPQNSIDFIDCFKGIKKRYSDSLKRNK